MVHSRFIPGTQKDQLIDNETGETLRIRLVEVLRSNSESHEYTALFGGTRMPFHLEGEVLDIQPGVAGTYKALLMSAEATDESKALSAHSRIIAIEQYRDTGDYIPCKTP